MRWLISPIGRVHCVDNERRALCGRWALEPHDNPPTAPDNAERCTHCARIYRPEADPDTPRNRAALAKERREASEALKLSVLQIAAANPDYSTAAVALKAGVSPRYVAGVMLEAQSPETRAEREQMKRRATELRVANPGMSFGTITKRVGITRWLARHAFESARREAK